MSFLPNLSRLCNLSVLAQFISEIINRRLRFKPLKVILSIFKKDYVKRMEKCISNWNNKKGSTNEKVYKQKGKQIVVQTRGHVKRSCSANKVRQSLKKNPWFPLGKSTAIVKGSNS